MERTAATRSGRMSGWPLIAICTGYFMVILDGSVRVHMSTAEASDTL